MRLRLTLLVATLLPSLAGAQVTAIRAGAVVDPDAGTTARNQVILVEKGRITAIGGSVAIPAGAKVIDLSSSTISPGLVDAHTHLCMEVQPQRDANNYYLTTLRDPDSYRTIEGVVNARTMLEAGFTSARDIGNEGNFASTGNDGKRTRSREENGANFLLDASVAVAGVLRDDETAAATLLLRSGVRGVGQGVSETDFGGAA